MRLRKLVILEHFHIIFDNMRRQLTVVSQVQFDTICFKHATLHQSQFEQFQLTIFSMRPILKSGISRPSSPM